MPVPRTSIFPSCSRKGIVMKYLSKKSDVPGGRVFARSCSTFGLNPRSWLFSTFRNVKYQSRRSPLGLVCTKFFNPVGYGFPGTYCFSIVTPVIEIICSSIQMKAGLESLRHAAWTSFKIGLTFRRRSLFWSSENSGSSTTLIKGAT